MQACAPAGGGSALGGRLIGDQLVQQIPERGEISYGKDDPCANNCFQIDLTALQQGRGFSPEVGQGDRGTAIAELHVQRSIAHRLWNCVRVAYSYIFRSGRGLLTCLTPLLLRDLAADETAGSNYTESFAWPISR
jgi:hypothetical protein